MKSRHVALSPGRPRVLAVVRWPVGGIRTWCRYVYGSPQFGVFEVEILMRASEAAYSFSMELKDTAIKVSLFGADQSFWSFNRSVGTHILRGKFSLVHSHGFSSGLCSTLPVMLRGMPHVVTGHDMVLENQYRDLRGRMARAAISWMLGRADCVHAVSNAAAANLRSAFPVAFGAKSHLRIVPSGIDPKPFADAVPQRIRHILNVPPEAILVGFFGRFMGPKGFRFVVDAVARYQGMEQARRQPIIVLAVGGGGFRREEESAISQSGLTEYFRFVDFMPDIAGYLKAVDVMVMPSLWEACGLLAMEAMVAGVPVVLSDCDALVDLAEGTPARVVRKSDAIALLDGILDAYREEAKLAAAAYSCTAAQRFDVSLTASGLVAVYHELIGSRKVS
jgi:glycosyltransferase involved in cell wall biosynthesis